MNPRIIATLGFAITVGLVVGAVGRGGSPTAGALPRPARVTVYIVQRVKAKPPTWGFDRASITIPPGTTVTWQNLPRNSEFHTSTAFDGAWNSPILNPGERWAFVFSRVGRYRYHCTPHPWMTGVINVVAGAPLPPPAPAPTPK